MKNVSIVCCKLFSIFCFSEKGKMQPRASTFHHLSFIIKMPKTYWLGNIKGNRMGCRILLIVVKSREISSKGRGEVPNGKFLGLSKKSLNKTELFPSGSLWGETYSTFGRFSHCGRRSSGRHDSHLTHELDPGNWRFLTLSCPWNVCSAWPHHSQKLLQGNSLEI